MGLDSASIKFCCAARSLGVDFRSTLMIGRQSMFSNARELNKVFAVLGVEKDSGQFLTENKYAEGFFSLLGAQEVTSLDYTDYEGAAIIQDLNLPVSPDLKSKFSVVYDGGTLEHIFNIPQALKNCMEMLEVGGYFLQANIANNFMGHGFWQFSPELLFRVFSPENGFEIKAVLIHERIRDGAWYLVKDPDEAGQRVLLCNSNPTYVLTIAEKTSACEIFENPPLQSDYVSLWNSSARHPTSGNSPGAARPEYPRIERGAILSFSSSLASRFTGFARKYFGRKSASNPFDRGYYHRVDECDVMRGQLHWPENFQTSHAS